MDVHCRPRIPREGGVYGVWSAGLALSLTILYRYGAGFEEILALSGYVIALFLINPTIKYSMKDVIACSSIPTLLSLPLILRHGIDSLPVIVVASMAALGMVLVPRYRQIIGAGLLVTPSSLILLDAVDPLHALLPMAYASMATAYALDVVVHGSSRGVRYSAYIASIIVISLSFTFDSTLVVASILLDLLSRILGIALGLYYRISLKSYGFLETIRVILVMIAVGISV